MSHPCMCLLPGLFSSSFLFHLTTSPYPLRLVQMSSPLCMPMTELIIFSGSYIPLDNKCFTQKCSENTI